MDKPVKEYNSIWECWEWKLPNGDFHREDGPAIEWYDGNKSWYLNDKQYTEEEHKIIMREKKLERILNG